MRNTGRLQNIWYKMVVILAMMAVCAQGNTLLFENIFHGKANGTVGFYATSNTSYIAPLYTPVGMYGSGHSMASREPYMHAMGVHIQYQNFLQTNNYYETGSNDYFMFGLYLYYISGTLGEFANLDVIFPSQNLRGYFTLEGMISGSDQIIEICMHSLCTTFGPIQPGWNFIMFGGSHRFFLYSICSNGNACSGATTGPEYSSLLNVTNTQRTLGCFTCTNTNVEYIIHSLTLTDGVSDYSSSTIDSLIGAFNTFPNTTLCGNGVRDAGESCDDGNLSNNDGCSSLCSVELGFECLGGSSTTTDICSDECGDGQVHGTVPSNYCDDGGNMNGDGCSATCIIETGYTCSGGSTTSADQCTDDCGDGFVYGTVSSTYCDDGNSVLNDGCDQNCQVESGYECTGGSTSSPDTCSDFCGDGRIYGSVASNYCDDSNNNNGDGCSSSCIVETGYTCSGGTTTSPDVCTDYCGDGYVYGTVTSTYCDDGNNANSDGCSSSCQIESGYTCSGGSTTTSSTCSDICGDGVVYGTNPSTYCDDGNNTPNDGCSSTCNTEFGYVCTGGSTSSSSTCSDYCGDGFIYGTVSSTYCDDGNSANSDGCNSSCQTESGYICSGGSTTTSSTCSDICGDGFVYGTNPADYCDDGNITPNDGCDENCVTEIGYECSGGDNTRADTCYAKCGDGIILGSEECDDGNLVSQDGCNSGCKFENGFDCTNGSGNPATICAEICGDGIRFSTVGCDDGNLVSGDGCSNSCAVEPGYSCVGGSSSSSDTCLIVCGDGVISGNPTTNCDDGNGIGGDGCSSECKIEDGYSCTSEPSICTEKCGDGRRIGPGCDDGNTIDGDGCSSICTEEVGFTCTGGSPTKKDTCVEECGDGEDYGQHECEDGNLVDGDGCSSTCEYETCYQCIGGTPSSVDICSILEIEAELKVVSLNSIDLIFTNAMQNNSISISDLAIAIQSENLVDFSWSAKYSSSNTLSIKLNINSILLGGEILAVRFINYKVFRGPNGGCVITEELSTILKSSLESSAESARSMGGITEYLIFGGIIVAFGVIMICGGTIEMIWSMVNTLQIITFLPLMTPYYPEHVKIMFKILEFVNMDFEYVSDLFASLTNIDGLDTPSYDSKFLENGVESPLFLDNCASLIMSFLLTLLLLLTLVTLFCVCRFEKVQLKLGAIISSYFWNNFLRFFTEGYLEFTFGALLNLASFTHKSTPEYVSLGLSGFTCLLCILFPFMTAALLYDNRKTISEGNEKYLKRFGTMYKEFKTDKEWYHFQYYPTFLIRRLIFVIFLILLLKNPETQCNSFILFSFLIFCYQALAKPFKEEIVNIISCINEGVLGCISLVQIIFVTDLNDPNLIDRTGWVMVSLMITMVGINFLIILTYSVHQKCYSKKSDTRVQPINSEIDPIVDATTIGREKTIGEIISEARQNSQFRRTNRRVHRNLQRSFSQAIDSSD